ncbi:cytochrome P460 family protein [Litoreibacter albidus]|uniref:Cytochrome P460 n=1 Tax=Litoreibacter albidus TaxID=670155 RepID=A0A1H2QSE4_9RHOB|nr:cytochrome P460 family protein [Litoreibacter albidus]SDW10092.1 Cytochrome P460 [Litoreibacter albidus]
MTIRAFIAAATAATALMAGAANAADCPVDVDDPFDLEAAQIEDIYNCLKDAMAEGYAKEGDEIGANYRSWTVTSTRPAVAGPHGNRLLQTFANDVAAEQYLKFAEEGVKMPARSVLAKESITISKKKKQARVGPLFIMTKMEDGAIPETDDWLYAGLQPNGKVMKIKQSFCHDCHVNYPDQDMLAYPLEEVRIGN